MSSMGGSSSSTEGAVADLFVGGDKGRFVGRARFAWAVNVERAAGLFMSVGAECRVARWLLIIIYFMVGNPCNKTPHPIIPSSGESSPSLALQMSSTLKPSSDSKRSHLSHQPKIPEQFRAKIPQLQDLFPDWSIDGPSPLTFNLTHPCLPPPSLRPHFDPERRRW